MSKQHQLPIVKDRLRTDVVKAKLNGAFFSNANAN